MCHSTDPGRVNFTKKPGPYDGESYVTGSSSPRIQGNTSKCGENGSCCWLLKESSTFDNGDRVGDTPQIMWRGDKLCWAACSSSASSSSKFPPALMSPLFLWSFYWFYKYVSRGFLTRIIGKPWYIESKFLFTLYYADCITTSLRSPYICLVNGRVWGS